MCNLFLRPRNQTKCYVKTDQDQFQCVSYQQRPALSLIAETRKTQRSSSVVVPSALVPAEKNIHRKKNSKGARKINNTKAEKNIQIVETYAIHFPRLEENCSEEQQQQQEEKRSDSGLLFEYKSVPQRVKTKKTTAPSCVCALSVTERIQLSGSVQQR